MFVVGKNFSEGTALYLVNKKRSGMSIKKISKEVSVSVEVVLELIRLFETKYPLPKWAVKQYFRETGLLEDICSHGIGHPNSNWLKIYDPDCGKWLGVHGCDSCCSNGEKTDKKPVLK